MKDILNERVKHREPFRPFAPSVLAEEANKYFELSFASPFMLLVAKVKNNVAPATTHVDETARVQTVTREDNGIYYDLISEFYKMTGVPIILNTSFNDAGEPIVESPKDAIKCFLSTEMDYLFLGNYIVWKNADQS
jgi:carbamoyltransferase